MPITYYVVPFGRTEEGELVPLEPIHVTDPVSAGVQARAAATEHGGAIAFRRAGDPNTGEFDNAVVIRTIGVVDEKLLGEWRPYPNRP